MHYYLLLWIGHLKKMLWSFLMLYEMRSHICLFWQSQELGLNDADTECNFAFPII